MLNHWFSPENSTDPELDRGPTGASTPHNLVTSITWNLPGSGAILERLAPEHGDAQPERLAVHDSLRRRSDRLRSGVGAAATPAAASRAAGRTQHRARHVHQLRRPHDARNVRGRDRSRSRFRADVFNLFNNQNLLAGGYINLVGNPRFGQHTGGSNVLPGRQFQFATDVSLLTIERGEDCDRHCSRSERGGFGHRARVDAVARPVRVRVQTELGDIVIEVDPIKAPITTANFLKYVDAGHYDGGIVHRTVKMDNQPESTVKIEVIQAGVNPDRAKDGFPGDRARADQRDRHPAQGRRDLDGARRARQRHVGLVHLHQRSAVARFRRQAQSRRPGLRRVRTRRRRAWTSCGRFRWRPRRRIARPTPRPNG